MTTRVNEVDIRSQRLEHNEVNIKLRRLRHKVTATLTLLAVLFNPFNCHVNGHIYHVKCVDRLNQIIVFGVWLRECHLVVNKSLIFGEQLEKCHPHHMTLVQPVDTIRSQ